MKLRRHYKLLVAVVGMFVGLIVLFGDMRVIPYTVSSETYAQDISDEGSTLLAYDDLDDRDIFDEMDIMHEVEIEMEPDDYNSMILTYEETQEKEYFSCDITIDGVTIENVGIRLKGNSSLRSALGESMGPGGGGGVNANAVVDYETPFMIKFDEFVDGQNYLGYTQISLRSQFSDETAMHEILANEIMAEMGFTASRSVYTVVNMNGEGNRLYIINEVINDDFLVDHLDNDENDLGDLFKVSGFEGNGQLTYIDEDPTNYTNYELQTNENISDLYDLIQMLKFINESDEEIFVEGIDEYLDYDLMIEYLAFCNVLVNLDSLAGNGNNFYLYQDPDTEQFMIIPWDMNESFGRFGMWGATAWEMGLYFEEFKEGGGGGGMGDKAPQIMGEDGEPLTPEEVKEMVENGELEMPMGPIMEQPTGGNAMQPFQEIRGDLMNMDLFDGMREPNIETIGLKPPLPTPQNQEFLPQGSAPDFNEEDLPLDEKAIWMQNIFEFKEYNEEYLKAIESLLENEFEEDKMHDRISELAEFLFEANDEYVFWTDEELRLFEEGIANIKEFVTQRHNYLWELLREELST